MEILLVTNNKDHLNSFKKFQNKNIFFKLVNLNQDVEDNSKTTLIKRVLKLLKLLKSL